MKYIVVIMIALVLLVSIGSCSHNKRENPAPQTQTTQTQTTQEATYTTKTTTNFYEEETEYELSDDQISWSDAINHIGETVTLVGEVKSTKYSSYSNGSPTFINIGVDYPDSDRVTVVIWGENRNNCISIIDELYSGDEIAVTGEIELYNGVAQIEVSSPDQIEILY